MQTSVGFFDALFGKKLRVEVPDGSGGTRTLYVTEKWLKKMAAHGRAKRVLPPTVKMVLNGPGGERVSTVRVGVEVDEASAREFYDAESNALYAADYFEEGRRKTFFMHRHQYEALKAQLESVEFTGFVDAEVARAIGKRRPERPI